MKLCYNFYEILYISFDHHMKFYIINIVHYVKLV